MFALSELAIVSSRKSRLAALAEAGRSGAETALRLARDSGRFLSTVQIGITFVGLLAGAVSGAGLGARLAVKLEAAGMPASLAESLGYGAAIAGIAYLSLIIGELVPKQLALRNPEGFACAMAPTMNLVARVAAPAVWFLDRSAALVLTLVGPAEAAPERVTEEELRSLVGEAEQAGIIEEEERQMIAGVLRLGDRPVRGIMTPRTEVDWIDIGGDDDTIARQLIETTHSRLPVGDGSPDAMLGIVTAREVLAVRLLGQPLRLRDHLRQAPVVPDTIDAIDVMNVLKSAEVPMVLIHDEYGHFQGLATPADILETIAGAFRSDAGPEQRSATRRADGSWLLPGAMPADEMAELLGVRLPAPRDYHTVAGLLLAEMRHLPATGECIDVHGWRLEVVDLDGRRIDKVLATPLSRRAIF